MKSKQKTTKAFWGCSCESANRLSGQPANSRNGQALVELAVFGSFFLLLFGVLLSYGLRFNFQQRADMTAFRRALKIASDENRGSGLVSITEQVAIPDPMSLFGTGTSQALSASASVTRDYQMHAQIVDAESLPGSVTDIRTSKDTSTGEGEWMRRVYKTAGFRIERQVFKDFIEKYELIFGTVRARAGKDWWVPTEDGNAQMSGDNFVAIRITDSCVGEMVDHDSCYTQARMIVDEEFCTKKCEMNKAPGSEINCPGVCSKGLQAPNQFSKLYNPALGGAWYAADYYCVNRVTKNKNGCKDLPYEKRQYVFPYLEQMFGAGTSQAITNMGLQPDTTTTSLLDESLEVTQTAGGTTTQEAFDWQDVSKKTIMYQDNLQPDFLGGAPNPKAGFQIQHPTPSGFINLVSEDVQITTSGSTAQTQQTPK